MFPPAHKRESGVSPEQYPLLSSPLWKAQREPLTFNDDLKIVGKADFSERARKPAIGERKVKLA